MKFFEYTDADLDSALESKLRLTFKGGSFRILMVSDIHGGVGYNREKTVVAMRALVDSQKPDIVLLGGDTAGPGRIHIETADQLKSLLTDITAPMEENGIPWAHVFGNHDDNYGLPNAEAEKVYESFPHCVSKGGPEYLSGSGNYVIPVCGSDGNPVFCVWGFDSHQGLEEFANRHSISEKLNPLYTVSGDRGGDDSLDFEQVMWYYLTSKAMEQRYGRKISGMMFMHIALPEFAVAEANKNDTHLTGYANEDVSFSALNSGLFRACVERGDIKAIFCGHDHENDWQAEYMGIKLGFDASMSYHACQINHLRGGRIFDISESDPFNIKTQTVKIADIMGHEGDSVD